MPSISDLIDQYSDLFSDLIIVRLLGGDRKEIEKKTSGQWDQIVEKKDIQTIGMKLGYLVNIGKHVTINVNNHYEGSAPLTIARLINEFQII